MAKRRRQAPSQGGESAVGKPVGKPAGKPAGSAAAVASGPVPWLLALIMVLAPGLGVPSEEMLQDTLKSMIVAVGALTTALLFFWRLRGRTEPLRWHAILWAPLVLLVYALGSMAWSHTYLAGAEAIRWFVFAVLLWLGLNVLDRDRSVLLAWGIHGGAVLASLWTVLQFWFDLKLFPQGPNPASTFVNRNFFAEFAVCTLPFSTWLLMRMRSSPRVALMSFSLGFVVVAILMTGTRSALIAMLAMAALLPVVLWRCRRELPLMGAEIPLKILAAWMVLLTVVGLGVVPTGNEQMRLEHQSTQRGSNALERGFSRTLSMAKSQEYSEGSFSVRWVMWSATARMVRAHPLAGVGAGAWEVDVPLYQEEGSQLETDYYAHNEPLQLLAEYGLAGWAFLLGLLGYLARAAWLTWRCTAAAAEPAARQEAPLRIAALGALGALLIVSNAGFPWRMATTGALFALALALLAASDARLGVKALAPALPWRPWMAAPALAASVAALGLAFYISEKAVQSERLLIQAVRIALAISAEGQLQPQHPQVQRAKAEMLELLAQGIAINPHYRKLTPMAADNLASWGDWKAAIPIWESVAQSRPYIVAILGNIARGYINLNDYARAAEYLERARKVQPKAEVVQSLELLLLHRSGRKEEATARVRQMLAEGARSYDIASAAYRFGSEGGDWPLALQGLRLVVDNWPEQAADAWLKSARIYAQKLHDEPKALEAYRAALAAVGDAHRASVLQQIPADYLGKL